MRALFVILLLVAVAAAGNWNTFDFNNRQNLNDRDVKHQEFVLNLLRHLHNDLKNKDFLQYSHTIKIDNKNDYKNTNKVFTFITMFQNGMYVKRGHTFNLLDPRNIVTTKVLYDFFDTMTNWNTVAQNLIWCRRHINEYQFFYLITLLQTHHREFNNIVLPAMYEVLPTQFFGGDVMNKGLKGLMLNFDDIENNKVVIMQNFTNGMMGSMVDDDNDNVFDLNDIHNNNNNKITDWYTLKKVVNDIHGQTRKVNMINMQNVRDNNKDIKTDVFNNIRNLNQGNKFDNNGEDRMNYFTQDIGLNNFYYFSRFGNSRILDDKQMYNNNNNKGTFQFTHGLTVNSGELKDKINRRGERYLYKMQQLLARYNLERLSNGLDNVKQINLDGKIDNGVFTNLHLTNGLQMHSRMNNYQVNNDFTKKLIDLVKDFENRYRQTIDQGFVETLNGRKITLNNKYGFNLLGNLLQGNTNNVNTQYYRTLETFYRLIFGGNYVDNADRADKRFTTTVMGQHETTLRDPVFWQIMKRINNIADQYKTKLVGYTKKDTDFKGVKINDVKVDKMVTTFGYFDADITNGFNVDLIKMCKLKNGVSSNINSDSGSVSRSRRRSGSGSWNRSNSGSFDQSVTTRFNRNGKFNNKFVNRNSGNKSYNSGSSSRSTSRGRSFNVSGDRSNTRMSWRSWFGFGKNINKSNRSVNTSSIKNLSTLRRALNNMSGIRKDRNLIKLRTTLNKLKNMSNVRGLKNVRGISKIRNNVSQIRNISKNRNNSLIRNLSKLRHDVSIIRKINENVSDRTMNTSVIRKLLKNVRNVNNKSIDRILRKINKNTSSGSGSYSRNRSFNSESMGRGMKSMRNWSNTRSTGSNSHMRHYLNKFGNRGTDTKLNYFKKIMGLDKFMVVGRQRRLDTKKFTVTIDVTSNNDNFGIVRMFLGPKINNKQQLNDNRKNFVEIDQFIVKLNNGQNIIKRQSIDFKNIVGNAESFNVLYSRTLNTLKEGDDNKNYNTLLNINYDTNNNNHGFPHRLLLPKGTTGGQDFTLFITINDLDRTNTNDVRYINDNNWNNFVKDTNKDNDDTSSNTSSDSSSSASRSNIRVNTSSFSRSDSRSNSRGTFYSNERLVNGNKITFNNRRNFNNSARRGDLKIRGIDGVNKVWCKNGNGVMIYNCNNGNKNVGNGNGVLDKRAFGFPLDRNIIDVNGFITDNMFFKDVKIVHIDTSNNN